MRTEILDARVSFLERRLTVPLVISSGAIGRITEARAEVMVRVGGREATGKGSIYLSDLWAWPEPAIPHEQRDAALRELCVQIARGLHGLCGGEPAHPTELSLRLHESVCREENPPALARAMCASPFDAAIHDAAGTALGRSAFRFYDAPWPLPTAERFFGGGASAAIAKTLHAPRRQLRAWYLVGGGDSMEQDLGPAVRRRGYSCFKVKLAGHDNAADAARTVEVFRSARRFGVDRPVLSVDTNEANPDAASVLDYLQQLRAEDADAFAALAYLEQPTARDIRAHRFDWRAVAALKPVMMDEGLTDLELMDEAAEQGWSGFALKTCKGHSFALVAAAWARQRGLLVSLQDLTNPGLALIHAALFAAHVPTINDVELNSPQYTPAANAEWLPRLAGLFEPSGGLHRLPERVPPGLGSML